MVYAENAWEAEIDLAIALKFVGMEKENNLDTIVNNLIAFSNAFSPQKQLLYSVHLKSSFDGFVQEPEGRANVVLQLLEFMRFPIHQRFILTAAVKIMFRMEYTPAESITLVGELSMRYFCLRGISGRKLTIFQIQKLFRLSTHGYHNIELQNHNVLANLLKNIFSRVQAVVIRPPLVYKPSDHFAHLK